jgi:hypothetical protein
MPSDVNVNYSGEELIINKKMQKEIISAKISQNIFAEKLRRLPPHNTSKIMSASDESITISFNNTSILTIPLTIPEVLQTRTIFLGFMQVIP